MLYICYLIKYKTMENEIKNVIKKDVALKELTKFIETFSDLPKDDSEILEGYPHLLQAIMSGNVVFDDKMKPTLTLKDPIMSDGGNVFLDKINFRTRIKPNQLADVMKGLDINKNQIEYSLRCYSFITQQPKPMFDKFSKFDYKTIEQICVVFL